MTQELIEIYTDGGCWGNPGPGGWGAVLRYQGKEKNLFGSEAYTTNNRMEMTAAIEALAILKKPCKVLLVTDSTYLKDGITSWIHGWKKNGWKTKEKSLVKNIDLWKRLDTLIAYHQVDWEWIKGHAGHRENEIADQLSQKAIQEFLKSIGVEIPSHHVRNLLSV